MRIVISKGYTDTLAPDQGVIHAEFFMNFVMKWRFSDATGTHIEVHHTSTRTESKLENELELAAKHDLIVLPTRVLQQPDFG